MNTSVRGFSVAHQRVSVEVEVTRRYLKGWTELTIVPTTLDLKEIVLDARRLSIEKCYINGIESEFEHFDLLSNPPKPPASWGVNQAALYGEKLRPLMRRSGLGPGELVLSIPDSIQIREPNDQTFIASHSTKEKTYEPLTLRIFYHIREDEPNEGLQFVNSNTKEAHVYTTHTPIGQATSCWLPCVDGLWSLSTWELEFHIPQLLDEDDPESEIIVACNNTSANEEPDPTNSHRKIVKFGIFSPVSSQHVGFAVGPFVQVPLVISEEKQLGPEVDVSETAKASTAASVNVDQSSTTESVAASNANGSSSSNNDKNDDNPHSNDSNGTKSNDDNGSNEKSTNNGNHKSDLKSKKQKAEGKDQATPATSSTLNRVTRRVNESQTLPITTYVLPSKASLAAHSCYTLPRAMDFFTRDFGSFPFDSYSVVFVADFPILADTTVNACALTICSDNLLFTADMIEPRFNDCEVLVRAVAAQWCGVNIVPSTWNDIWVTEGISLFMTSLFIRNLMGNNEYRFRIRKGNDELCREDIDRPPIGKPHFRFPLCAEDLKFIRLKAPLVLFILDRRMTKTDRSLGVSRVLTKLFLQSMSGDLRSQLSTAHFVRQCEKVAHHRLTSFFDEWVFNSGYPIFRITQRFNKKRLCIEMGIGQVHSRELPPETLTDKTFLERAITHLNILEDEGSLSASEAENLKLLNELAGSDDMMDDSISFQSRPDFLPLPSFTGPMTIRIHEANGTPYEHVVELRDQLTKIDIPYNTKYKRLRRNQKFRKATATGGTGAGAGSSNNKDAALANEPSDGLINCLGDVLMTDSEIADWNFVDWGDGGEEEELMFNEAFEWLRADADFEWLGQFFVSQPDYMYASQLQQDRDIVAQYDAVEFYGRQQPNPIYCTILTRTLMDTRYYYGVRVAAAFGLAKLAVPQLQYAGMHLLLRIFRTLYCFDRSKMPKSNNFEDFAAYFVQKAIPMALSLVRDQRTGRCPQQICSFILDLIRYNENSENAFSDAVYMANLLECATNTLRPIDLETGELTVRGSSLSMDDNEELRQYVTDVVNEIDKCQRLDRWVPSHLRIVTTTAMKMEELLILAGYGHPRMDKLLLASKPEETDEVRLTAITSMLHLGGYRNAYLCEYLQHLMLRDPAVRIRNGILEAWKLLVGHIAINGEFSQDTDPRKLRQLALARKSVRTAIPSLRESLGSITPVKGVLWTALMSSEMGSLNRRHLLEICQALYPAEARLIARMKLPRLYQLSLKRRRDSFIMVAKYRNVLKKTKSAAGGLHGIGGEKREAVDPTPAERPKIRLKLR